MKKHIPIIIGLILIVMFLSNPTKDDFVSWSCEQVNKETNSASFAGALSSLLSKPMLNAMTTRENFTLFSVFEVNDMKFIGIFKQFILFEQSPKKVETTIKKTNVLDNKTEKNDNINSKSITPTDTSPIEDTEITWITYNDDLYDYTYIYPSDMIIETDKLGKQDFVSKDKLAKMNVFVKKGTDMKSEIETYTEYSGSEQTYKASGQTWAAYSFSDGTTDYYIKLNVIADSFIRIFTLESPTNQKTKYSNYTSIIEKSLKQI